MDFSQALAAKRDIIVQTWIETVRQDLQIPAVDDLPRSAIRDHLPDVLVGMVSILSQTQDNDIQSIVERSLEHGVLRAAQGFAPNEIAREYHLLRRVIFATLETDFLKGTVSDVIRAYSLIDTMIDEAITQCFNSYVEERLCELHQLQSQAELTNQELTRLVKANQDNLSQLAHELKNPLNSIIGYSELMLRASRKVPETRDTTPHVEHIETVVRNGRQLLRLINDALEISRYEAGKMDLHPEPTEVRSVIKDVVEMLKPLADTKALELVVDCDRAPATVYTDSLRLQQIVTNLLSNAIRYTKSGTIWLSCETLGDRQWLLAVKDTGIGIAPEEQSLVFDPFYRAENNEVHVPDSTGLGLAIVSQLVNLMQGKIELKSQLGVGSTFTVTWPLKIQA
ncbi:MULTISPECIES: HAMP domain-containing sensor histidine kinase [Trichocoleus]|uniref:histidine kinase n=1 Tax=Trichocoleus desertorum GB2-A4 TaxID=2933944 RepID=A0ABV0JC68_9CYAN|nr:HAMP domain-containing sensor histidine kinase [Trichocoleus sp. FACHB-46]MBD1864038.1 HAMP domain-containing histidine kinase [Trichocoleus sp. FACHB-46]